MTLEYRECLDTSVYVPFTYIELRSACIVGRWIWEASHEDGRKDRDGWRGFTEGENPGLRHQCLGSLCERIAAKALGIYWPSSFNNFGEPDLPHNVEVKLIGVSHYGLRVYPRTHDSRRVVGVVIPKGTERQSPYRVAGWYIAGDAKREEWKLDPHDRALPMYGVPQEELRPIPELRRMIALEVLEELDQQEEE